MGFDWEVRGEGERCGYCAVLGEKVWRASTFRKTVPSWSKCFDRFAHMKRRDRTTENIDTFL